ncbi:MAG: twin-arginine translocase TatA/TatE family subunit [Novosphingobium sp.]
MFGLSPVHLLVLAVVVLVLFGRGKVSEFMGDFGKGVKSFKQGMADETTPPPAAPPQIPPAAQNQGTLNGETVVDPTSRPPQ